MSSAWREGVLMKRRARLRSVTVAEGGQAIVEFALVLVLLIVLLMVPVDVFRYINTRMILNDAATDAVSMVSNDSIESGTAEADILNSVNTSYGTKLKNVQIDSFDASPEHPPAEYDYRVFNSDKQTDPDPSKRFDNRASNYHFRPVSLKLKCTEDAITPIGGALFGGMHWTITSDAVTCNVYTRGYVKP